MIDIKKKRSSSDEHAKDVEAQDETIHHRHDSLSHHATVGGVLSQIGLIYEKKAKQDKLDRKHGRKHPPLNEIIEDFYITAFSSFDKEIIGGIRLVCEK